MISQAAPLLEKITAENNFAVTVTGDTRQVYPADLVSYQGVVQLQEASFDTASAVQAFIEPGKG